MRDNMKYLKLTFLATIILMVISSCVKTTSQKTEKSSLLPRMQIEVVYFHGKQRCPTCRAIELLAKETVDSCFAGNDTVAFKTIDITTPEGEQIADVYEIAGSSLLIIKTEDGISSHEDLTAFAFKNARRNTSLFKRGIENKVREYLRQN